MAGEALSPRSGRCERARQWVSLRLDGELSELEGALLENHLESCAACRSFSERVELTTDAVRAATLEQPRIAYELPRRMPTRLPVRRRTAIAAIAAAAALGSFVGSWLQNPAPAPARTGGPQISFLTDMKQLRQLPHQTKRPEPVPARVPGQPPEGVV